MTRTINALYMAAPITAAVGLIGFFVSANVGLPEVLTKGSAYLAMAAVPLYLLLLALIVLNEARRYLRPRGR